MKAIVCVKQVPDTSGKVAVKADGTLDRASMATITNPDDLNALEAALKLKDETGCEVVVVTMGPPPAEGMLREIIARGVDRAVLISGRLNLWFSSSIMEGLNESFHDEGYDISIYQMSSAEERRTFFDMLPVRRNVDAVIVISFDIDSNEIRQLRSVDVPIIGINSSLPEERGFNAAVRIDDKQGSELAARHLITLGHRDIAYIRTDREVTLHFSVQGRFDSFMTCCKSNGVEPRVFVTDEGKNNISKVVTQLLSSDHMPTAIACQEDGIAIPLLFQLERNGFTIPNDISIIGYDDSTYARDLGLTTIRQTPVEMAHEAARMTLALIDKQPLDEPFKTFPAQLIVRSTTARLRH